VNGRKAVRGAGSPSSLFGLAPGGVCPAPVVAAGAVRSYRDRFTLACAPGGSHRRFVFCGTFRGLAAPGR